jgi:hypothetical protein
MSSIYFNPFRDRSVTFFIHYRLGYNGGSKNPKRRGGRLMNDQIDYRDVRRRVEKSVKKQKQLTNAYLFGLNIFLLVMFMLIAYGMVLSSSAAKDNEATMGAVTLLSIGWLVSIIFHGVSLFLDTKWGEQQFRDKATARELGRELLQLGSDEEPLEKHKRMLRLGDDGEMEEVETDENVELAARSSNSH